MFTTGSKTLISASTTALGLAIVYGVTQGGALGTFGLLFATFGLVFLTIFYVAVRDADVSPMDHDAFPSAAAAQTSARPTVWPLLLAAGTLVTSYGLVSNVAFVLVGLVLMLAGGVEWMVQNWSEHISTDRRYNSMAREQLADPLEIPVGGALLAGIVAFGFSRVMLGLPSRTATVIAFVVLAAVVLAVGAWMALRPSVSATSITGLFTVGILALGVAGVVFGIAGPREVEAHETTADIAEEDMCGPEETHADDKATQNVTIKSGITAEVTFDGSALIGRMPGVEGDFDKLTIIRNNASNVLFKNHSDEPARLVMELHPKPVDAAAAETTPAPVERVCTALTEPGGEQLLTFNVVRPSAVVIAETGEGYAFNVAGTDTELGVDVP